MTKNTKSFVLPLAFIGVMFFSLGFALGINSVLVPVLKGSLEISSAESYLIIAATFIPFLIFGYPAGLTIQKNRIQTNNGPFIPYVCHSLRTFHTIGKLRKFSSVFYWLPLSAEALTLICKLP